MSAQVLHWSKIGRNIAFGLAVCLTLYFGLFAHFLPPFEFPEYLRGHGDRHIHIAAFFGLTVTAAFGRQRMMFVLLMMIAAAIVLEAAQIWMPNRSANLLDLYASLAGVGIGGALSIILNLLLLPPSKPPLQTQ